MGHTITLKLETAKASMEIDRRRILNTILELWDLECKPPSADEKFTSLNRLLHGRFAASLYRSALERGKDMCVYQAALRLSDWRA